MVSAMYEETKEQHLQSVKHQNTALLTVALWEVQSK